MKKVYLFHILLLFPLFTIAAQDADPAVLVRGPLPHDGIEYLGVNVIPSSYGEYIYNDSLISVYFTFEEVFLSEEWAASECGIAGASMLKSEDQQLIIAYSDRRGWTAFLSFEPGFESACGFLDKYISRQNYFLNLARDTADFSFPAFLELD